MSQGGWPHSPSHTALVLLLLPLLQVPLSYLPLEFSPQIADNVVFLAPEKDLLLALQKRLGDGGGPCSRALFANSSARSLPKLAKSVPPYESEREQSW